MSVFTSKGNLHAQDYLEVIIRRKKVIIVTFVAALLGALYVNHLTPPVFVATAQLAINPDLPQAILGGQVNPYMAELNEDLSIETQLRIIQSDPIAEGVVRRLELADEEKDPVAFNSFLRAVKRVIEVERVRSTRLFNITARSNKGQEAADIANAAAEVFIEQSLQAKFDASRRSVSWLTEQIMQMRRNLEESELALLEYRKKENFSSAAVNPEFQSQKLADLHGKYIEIQSDTNEMKAKIQQINKILASKEIRYVPVGLSSSLSTLNQELSVANLEIEKVRIEYKEKHPKVIRLQGEIVVVEDQIRKELKKAVRGLESELQMARSKENSLKDSLDSLNKRVLTSNEKLIKMSILDREVETYNELYNLLVKKLKAADLTQGIGESNYRIIEYAKNPRWPIRPRKKRNVLFGIIMGTVIGLGMAFVVEYFDRTIRTPDDLEGAIDLPLLVTIPKVHGGGSEGASIFLTKENQQSPVAVAFHALRTNIRFAQAKREVGAILVTSSTPSEGKTTIALNLGISLAHSNIKTLLVDSDLRKPRLHKVFAKTNDEGVTMATPGNVLGLIQRTETENLDILTSGPQLKAPFEFLETDQMKEVVDELRKHYQQIVFDSPPVASVVDASIISTYVDGVLFVLNSGKIESFYLKHAVEQLAKVKANLIGIVLNNLERRTSKYYYNYTYRGYYGERAKELIQGIKETVRGG